jgi:hypothetical protein
MTERKYSVGDLDALRRAVRDKWLWGSYHMTRESRASRSYREDEMTKAVEEIVRTHMLAGHTAEDLYASEMPVEPTDGK